MTDSTAPLAPTPPEEAPAPPSDGREPFVAPELVRHELLPEITGIDGSLFGGTGGF